MWVGSHRGGGRGIESHVEDLEVGVWLTTVWTIPGLWSLSVLTVWKISTTPSVFSLSSKMLMAMKVPERPVPPLQGGGRNGMQVSAEAQFEQKVLTTDHGL